MISLKGSDAERHVSATLKDDLLLKNILFAKNIIFFLVEIAISLSRPDSSESPMLFFSFQLQCMPYFHVTKMQDSLTP